MSYAQERIDIEARLATGWTTTSIAFGNGPFVPTPGTPWIRCSILPGRVGALGFGRDADVEYSGIIDIGIFVTRLSGTALARTYADTLAALFHMKKFGTVDCDEASVQNVGEEEDWCHFVVSIPFSRIE
ncbi:MAG TPA: phage tail terminator-like protein [Candidatus Thermoplasmatota archaeon]|nr:phage tail terminator-like protein [Candidatus Thermoplasmatota archaeon]